MLTRTGGLSWPLQMLGFKIERSQEKHFNSDTNTIPIHQSLDPECSSLNLSLGFQNPKPSVMSLKALAAISSLKVTGTKCPYF